MLHFINPFEKELIGNANKISVRGKGILAADESTGTIGKRFNSINLENKEENRRKYRELLFTTEGIEKYISGVIMYEETLFQKTKEGIDFSEILQKKGIIPGIKVDMGLQPLYGTDDETVTQGITGLAERCQKYYKQGARFAKWRAALKISKETNCPSQLSINENANRLARYAAICQANGLVPIVEPEILMDGDHPIEDCQYWTEKIVATCYKALSDHNVLLEGSLLKPNMVCKGIDSKQETTPDIIAQLTVKALQRSVPCAVPGIMFLSGGMSEVEATKNLNAMNSIQNQKIPWSLSFSFGRALQATCIKTWKGLDENFKKAQDIFFHRARANSLAQLGKYTGEDEVQGADDSLFVRDYKY
ncbi:fructose-bisphosphate aldolase [Anaeramoeba ignava]|uniref:Fructose-bisphosphate aldolase n=1 Tax=Anaeramoeba ignava TaxID=1746090 RepID=A0A9Q0R4E2_ANAIG|nr:fructose-bisphosphate aldolase [Anaeramoeba ignava]